MSSKVQSGGMMPRSRYSYDPHYGHTVISSFPYRERATGKHKAITEVDSAYLTLGGFWRVTIGGLGLTLDMLIKEGKANAR